MRRSWSSWLLLALSSTALWGIWGLIVKSTLTDISWRLVVTISLGGYLIPLLGIYILARPTATAQDYRHVYRAILPGLIAQLAIFSFYLALDRGQASVVVPLSALYPAITLLGTVTFLKEPISRVQVFGVAIALVAAVLLAS